MAVETGTYISDLVETNPVGSTDKVQTLDNHDRLVKKVLLNSFPDHNFQVGSLNLAGSADTYTITFVKNAPAAYIKYMTVTGVVNATNTGASTLNVNGLGAKSIKLLDGSALAAGDLTSGRVASFIYDGTNFVLTQGLYLPSRSNSWTGAQRGTFSQLTFGATVAVDFDSGNNLYLTATGDCTIGQPSNQVDGQLGFLIIEQDATGGRTVSYHADWNFGTAGIPTPNTSAGKKALIAYVVDWDTIIMARHIDDF